ncbi:MAG TPA: 1-(5-phosphoribosyl)-5-[(5-phosphoribosylamino)methylideneamino]imidazole-4-carboxamide isomerase [Methylomusa anaerophila]|uniref:1-(5-phosphoribosyl)-5-[(5-phosphoribosylamino)methylideneamino] imidazole-4-carboxamide isomerase n=1 Tax=Methylomusa anaerophila TaxID=1930071 RepID=A0A348AMR1_9FIRM|nr:1-(5-phosphoribosyl)-5-[(5-phosphoribosylamino)methylideneamino]imidazole-4-carboxamide isomerase [Methylomusa anaerophila]BBB92359.1 1-(5-phosphoribosyl)-5-[(5-phosphoribosylamino) methylideneamino] imidazole-4-carboxamide isomerase [Methylomusa anaerophila]HML90002.1 1-(5-phosphoribosyl)-5-[(5-phosphoribosylamino)methylideneamino]imidazole-4-carboxamide isomerase [Methylomusa anaerophila]
MIIFPAIDIRGGKCVRLTEGRFDQETVFADNPAAMAIKWAAAGATYLHVVDLDGALAGKPVNVSVIAEIVQSVAIPIQIGGGIRTLNNIETVLASGVERVILGSVAVRNPELVKTACREFGERIVIGIDARDGLVAVEGWGVSGGIAAEELAKRMADKGVARIIYTDISRDGTLRGVNVAATASLARAAGIPVIASGGVSSIEDIRLITQASAEGIEGVIVGKAIYTGALDLPAALALVREGVI